MRWMFVSFMGLCLVVAAALPHVAHAQTTDGAPPCTGMTGTGDVSGCGGVITDVSALSDSCGWGDLVCVAKSIIKWFGRALIAIPELLFNAILCGLLFTLKLLSPIAAIQGWPTLMANVQGAVVGIGYACDVFAVKPGLGLIFGALLARFLLRRVPLIG